MLPADLETKLTAALARERAVVEATEKAAETMDNWWNRWVGGPSGQSEAVAARNLFEQHVKRYSLVRYSGDLTEAGKLLRDLGDPSALNSESTKVARSATFVGGVSEVAAASAADLKKAAAGVLDFARWLPWLLGAAAALVVVVKLKPRKR